VPFDLPFVIPCLIADPIILAVNIREKELAQASPLILISLGMLWAEEPCKLCSFCSLTQSNSESDYPDCAQMKVTARPHTILRVISLITLFFFFHLR
jgi:hypothetical protein